MILKQPQGNYVLKKKTGDETAAAPETKNSTSAKELVGKYAPAGATASIEISIKVENAVLNIPGQQPYILLVRSKDLYSLSPLPET
jgi:hypothetical protein